MPLPRTSAIYVALLSCSIAAVTACSEPPVTPLDSGSNNDGSSGMDSSMDAAPSDGSAPTDTGVRTDTGVTPDGADPDGASGDGAADDGASGSDSGVVTDTGVIRDTGLNCVPGAISCATQDRTRTCLPDGGYDEADCPAGQVCAEGVGCTACMPGARRCNAAGSAVEECSADGRSWTMMTACNLAMGQVCEGFRCVDLCARAASQRSYLGCEYWPTTLPNPLLPNQTSFTFGVTIANPNAFPVTATFTGGGLGATTRTVMVPANSTQTENLPWVAALSTANASALARGGAYRLTTNAPVAVYQFNPLQFQSGGGNSFTNDASLLLPTHVLTGNYSIMTHGSWSSYGSFGAIVGTRDGTMVSVALRAPITAGAGVTAAAMGATVNYTLNRGDVLLLTNNTGNASCTGGDLTGSVVTASAPVATYGGHVCTQMPCGSVACDHLEEQLFPAETWGSSYVVSGLRERGATEPAVVRILSRTDGNTLTFTGLARPAQCPAMLNAGQFCEFSTPTDFQVAGSAPLLIAQYMVGEGAFTGVGDPAMVLEVPTQQFRTNYVFNVPASYTTNFLTVTYETAGARPSLDGTMIAAGTAIAGTRFSISRFTLAAGNHRMTGALPFGIKVTGTASYTSYMYPGGLDLNQLTAL